MLEVRDRIAEMVRPLDVELPPALEEAYETEREDLGTVGDAAQEHLEAATSVVAARAILDADRGLWTTIGLWGADPAAKVNAAVRAFQEGELQRARDSAADAEKEVAGAAGAGQTRAAGAGGAALFLILAGFGTRALVRRRKPQEPPAEVRVPGP